MELEGTLQSCSEKAVTFLDSNLDSSGAYTDTDVACDLCTVYKLPELLLLSGREKLAFRVLDSIKSRFQQKDGDFVSFPSKSGSERKTANKVLAHFWPYMNGWITMAAHKAGRFDISYPGYRFLMNFFNPKLGGFCVSEPYNADSGGTGQEVDVLVTSHLGLLCLLFGDIDKAKSCADLLVKFVSEQENTDNHFLLRKTADTGVLVKDFPTELSPFYKLSKDSPNQLYFMLGYPVLFLHQVYQATGTSAYLNTAENVLDYLWTCDESIYSFHFSHKVAYAAALVAKTTGKTTHSDRSKKIVSYLVTLQTKEGDFLPNAGKFDNFDQSTEIAIWMKKISSLLSW